MISRGLRCVLLGMFAVPFWAAAQDQTAHSGDDAVAAMVAQLDTCARTHAALSAYVHEPAALFYGEERSAVERLMATDAFQRKVAAQRAAVLDAKQTEAQCQIIIKQAAESRSATQQGLAIVASMVANLEACAARHPKLKDAARDPIAAFALPERERRWMQSVMDTAQFPAALADWRRATAALDARQLESECQAMLHRLR